MYLSRWGSMFYRTKPMKKILFAAVAACLFSAAPALAFAGDLNRESTRLPDGSQLIVITTKQGGLVAPSSSSVTRFLCSAPPTVICTMLGSESKLTDGVLTGLPSATANALGLREFGRSLRPDESNTYNSNYNETGVGVTGDGDVNTNNSGNDYSSGDGKG
jgi:hypothetical protein